MTVCSLVSISCSYYSEKISLADFDDLLATDGVCQCLQTCNSVEYRIELISYPYKESFTENSTAWETMIELRYKESEYFPHIRYREFKTKDFLAYIGGLLGLFAGLRVNFLS